MILFRFRLFEYSFKEVSELFDWWERSAGAMNPGAPSLEALLEAAEESLHSGKKGKQDRNKGKSNLENVGNLCDTFDLSYEFVLLTSEKY